MVASCMFGEGLYHLDEKAWLTCSPAFAKRSGCIQLLHLIMDSEPFGTSRLVPWAEAVLMLGLSLQVCEDYAVLRSRTLAHRMNIYRCSDILTAKNSHFWIMVAHDVI